MASTKPTPVNAAYKQCWEALQALQRAQNNGGVDPKTGQTADAAAKLHYKALGKTLRAINAPENWDKHDIARQPIPRFLIFELGQIIDDLLTGRVPEGIRKTCFGRKRPGDSGVQRCAKEAAVRYLVAVEDGLIDDENPIAKVSRLFEVTPHAARRWRREWRDSVKLKLGPKAEESRDALKALLLQHLEENAHFYRSRRHVKTKK